MSTKNAPRRRVARPLPESIAGLDGDIEHVRTALGRVKAPMARYAIVLAVDLVTERLQQLESSGEFLIPAPAVQAHK